MICLFEMTNTNIKTNEDYRRIVKKKMTAMGIIALLGIVTLLAAVAAAGTGLLDSESQLCAMLAGLGCGLIVAGILKTMLLRNILRDEERLKNERLKYTDERNQMIAAKAIHSAALMVLVVSFVLMLIGAFCDTTVFYCFWLVIIGFTCFYMVCTKYYNRKM